MHINARALPADQDQDQDADEDEGILCPLESGVFRVLLCKFCIISDVMTEVLTKHGLYREIAGLFSGRFGD